MRTIRIIEHISLDGVIQGPGAPGEDPSGGFALGGWAAPYADPVAGAAIVSAQGSRFDLLLGRRTYDIFAGYWPQHANNPIGKSLNAATKHVVTHRPDSAKWGPVMPLAPDTLAELKRIKAQTGPDLIVWGSSTLTPLLLQHELADEVLLVVCPVLLGAGKRFFADGTPARALKPVSSTTGASGVMLNLYRPDGPARAATFSA